MSSLRKKKRDLPENDHYSADYHAADHPPRSFRPRSVLIPVFFLAMHWLAINLVATLYVVIYAFLDPAVRDPLGVLGDPAWMNTVLTHHYPLISVFYSALLIPFYWVFLYLQNRRDSRTVWLCKAEVPQIFPALAVIVGALGLTNIWFNLLLWFADVNPQIDRLLTEYMETASAFTPALGYFWLVLGISILTPITEELLFRGIIQGELRKAMPEWAAILIQGIVFAAFHVQPIQISYVLLPGILLGIVYAWTRSLWIPIIMHMAFNFLGSVMPALVGEDEIFAQILGISEMAFILVGLLCLIFLYRNRRETQTS
jgi:uncharacterized protein